MFDQTGYPKFQWPEENVHRFGFHNVPTTQ